MDLIVALVKLVVSVLVISAGAHLAGIRGATFWKSLVVAFLSWVIVAILTFFAIPVILIPFINVLVMAVIAFAATSIAAKMVFDVPWEKVWLMALIVGLLHLIIGLF